MAKTTTPKDSTVRKHLKILQRFKVITGEDAPLIPLGTCWANFADGPHHFVVALLAGQHARRLYVVRDVDDYGAPI